MIHLLIAAFFPEWLWHPLGQCAGASANHLIAVHEATRCKSYNWYSGFAANFGELTIFTAVVFGAWRTYRRLECDVEQPQNCRRIGHRVPGTAHYACPAHHPHGLSKGGLTAEDLRRQHDESGA